MMRNTCHPNEDVILYESFETGRRYYCQMESGKPSFYSTEMLDADAPGLEVEPEATSDGAVFVMDDYHLGLVRVREMSATEVKRALPGRVLRNASRDDRREVAAAITRGADGGEPGTDKSGQRACGYERHEWQFRNTEYQLGTVYAWHDCETCGAVLCEEFENMGESVTLASGRKQGKKSG